MPRHAKDKFEQVSVGSEPAEEAQVASAADRAADAVSAEAPLGGAAETVAAAATAAAATGAAAAQRSAVSALATPTDDGGHFELVDGRPVDELGQVHREAAAEGESPVAVIAAVVANILIGIVKFIAAGISGSSAMISEGIHSIVDSGNGLLILLGMKRAERPADVEHPFGYGKELYFWTLVVSILIFALGGGVSIWEGVHAIQAVGPDTKLGDPTMSYIVLGIAAVIEGVSLSIAIRQFNRARGSMRPMEFIRQAKDPSLFTVVFEDSAAELGLVVAFLGIFFGHLFNNPYCDGVAAVIIGLLLCTVAVILLRETKGLLIGEGVRSDEVARIRDIVEADEAVAACGRVLTMYMGPHNLMVTVDAAFFPDQTAGQVLRAIDRIEAAIVREFPQADRVFIEAESLKQVHRLHEQYEPVAGANA